MMSDLRVPVTAMNTLEVIVVLGLLESYLESFGSVTEQERPDTYRAMRQVRVKLRRLLEANHAAKVSA